MQLEHGSEQDGVRMTPRVLIDERLLPKRFLLVSNRLPYEVQVQAGDVELKRGVGGLVTALDPIMKHTGGMWIGWSGSYERTPQKITVLEQSRELQHYNLRPMNLSREEIEKYYLGYSNKCIWPLFHYFQEHCEFHEDQWQVYQDVNRRFAEAVIDEYRDGDLIWVHDYHLLLLPAMIRRALPEARSGFFLHIPFPSEQIFSVEPHAEELLAGLLGADLIGFQVRNYANMFLEAIATLTDHSCARDKMTIRVGDRTVRLGVYPISIDFDYFADMACLPETEAKVREIRDYSHAESIAIGVDRLDYTKGIFERLVAIDIMLERYPDIRGKFTFIQISAPSRTKLPVYKEMRQEVERMVGHINGRFSGKGCLPIDYRYESFSHSDLVAYYRASDIALVTALRDGMNLVSKEYVASRFDEMGMPVLSRFTGACRELKDAIIVNPYDTEGTAEKIYEAIKMPAEEKRRRMRRMREIVRRDDIYWWLERFLRDVL
jgi:alpha,alpha-trehalose-phosphate synthase [UDP-forming]